MSRESRAPFLTKEAETGAKFPRGVRLRLNYCGGEEARNLPQNVPFRLAALGNGVFSAREMKYNIIKQRDAE